MNGVHELWSSRGERPAAERELRYPSERAVGRLESAYVRRMRLDNAVTAAALSLVTKDLVQPEIFEILAGPWRSVVHD